MMYDNLKNSYQLIDTEYEIDKIVDHLNCQKKIAVDLEADSMFHFKEKVCLIQIATQSRSFVIDPLAINNLGVLNPVFVNPDIQKVFHGSDYDVRSLHRDFGIEINNLFDTELACRFLGVRETGLSSVLNNRFGIKLDKRFQKKDWSQRPLPVLMVEYGIKDVRYLLPLTNLLEKELFYKNRYDWVVEECKYLSRVRYVNSDDTPLFAKFKGAGRLDSRSLAILESLLKFRIKIARQKDRPPFKVIGSNAILTIVNSKPRSFEHLKKLKILTPKQFSMYGKKIVNIINSALKTPVYKLPKYPHMRAPVLSPVIPKRVKVLKKWRDQVAQKLELDPAILFNKALLTTISAKNPLSIEEVEQINDLKEWQKKEFGHQIVKILKNID